MLTLCCCCVPVPVQGAVPARFRADKQLVSHDIHTSTYNYKYTFSVEIAPVCKVSLLQGGAPHECGRQLRSMLWVVQCGVAGTPARCTSCCSAAVSSLVGFPACTPSSS